MSSQNDLPAVSKEALISFRAATPEIIKETVARSLLHKKDIAHHGQQAERLITSGLEFTTSMLDSAMSAGVTELLMDQVLWAKDRLPFDGVSVLHIISRLNILRSVIIAKLAPEEGAEVVRFVDWMIVKFETFVLPH
jgi:hypothetical protein